MDETQNPRLVIEFDGEGSAHFQILKAERITPLQMLTVAAFLKFKAEYILSMQETAALQAIRNQQEMHKIAIPEGAKRLLK